MATADQQLQLVLQETSINPNVQVLATATAVYTWNADTGPLQSPPQNVQLLFNLSGTLRFSSELNDISSSTSSIPVFLPS